MAFKMSGFSPFAKNGDPPPQDPPSGRNKKQEMMYDMSNTKKEIKRFEKEGNNKAIGNLKSALARQEKAYIDLYGKLPSTFE